MAQLLFKVPVEIEPKFNHRFVLEFPKEAPIESWVVQKVSTLKFNPGSNTWDDLEIEFIDPIDPSTTQSLVNLINYFKEQPSRTWIDKLFKTSKPLFVLNLKSLDPTGVEVESWTIDVTNIVSVSFGDFDYASDLIKTCHLTLKINNCKLDE